MYVKCYNDFVFMYVFKYIIKYVYLYFKIYDYICKRFLIYSYLKFFFKVYLLYDWFSGGILFDIVIVFCFIFGFFYFWCVFENVVFIMYVVLE